MPAGEIGDELTQQGCSGLPAGIRPAGCGGAADVTSCLSATAGEYLFPLNSREMGAPMTSFTADKINSISIHAKHGPRSKYLLLIITRATRSA